jgi:hypothetical protein
MFHPVDRRWQTEDISRVFNHSKIVNYVQLEKLGKYETNCAGRMGCNTGKACNQTDF